MSPHPHLTQTNTPKTSAAISSVVNKFKSKEADLAYTLLLSWCVWKSKCISPCWIGQHKFAQQRTSLCKMNVHHRHFKLSFREAISIIPGTSGRPRRCRNWAARSRRCHWRACSAVACPWRSPALQPSLLTETETILANELVQFVKIPCSKSTGEKRSSAGGSP